MFSAQCVFASVCATVGKFALTCTFQLTMYAIVPTLKLCSGSHCKGLEVRFFYITLNI